jgi:hypothetical protein
MKRVAGMRLRRLVIGKKKTSPAVAGEVTWSMNFSDPVAHSAMR